MTESSIDIQEMNDDKSENLLLGMAFSNEKVIDKLQDIYDFLNEKEITSDDFQDSFISRFYQKLDSMGSIQIGDKQKQELMCMFFGKHQNSREDIKNQLLAHSEDIVSFRKRELEDKGLLLFFMEAVIAEKINIDDIHYDTLSQAKTDKEELTNLVVDMIVDGLGYFKQEIALLMESYKGFADKYLSVNDNYLSNQELERFKNLFLDIFNNLFIYITIQDDVKEQIAEINKRIENGVVLN